MPVRLTVISGPHRGRMFDFDGRDLFLMGRAQEAHFHVNEVAYSRIHFALEINPPWCRLVDPGSRNGTFVNGHKVQVATLRGGDIIKAGHSELRFERIGPNGEPEGLARLGSLESSGTLKPLVDASVPILPPKIPGDRHVREIGAGDLGRVYLAEREEDKAQVAIKTILPAVLDDPALVKRFLEDAQILGGIIHPHIVEFFEVGTIHDRIYVVMEYVRGEDLLKVLSATGRLDPPIAVRIACQLLDGIAYAHGEGFIHWDIKPANILLAKDGAKRAVKLADFNLARLYRASPMSGVPMTSVTAASTAYIAPEQITHYRTAGPNVDQYSTAAVLYHALSGTPPFPPQKNTAAMYLKILQDNPQHLRDLNAGVPPALAEVVHRALRKDPPDRFATAQEFRAALTPFK